MLVSIFQEDAHEFLLCCLDAVERDSLKLFKRLNRHPFKPGQVLAALLWHHGSPQHLTS